MKPKERAVTSYEEQEPLVHDQRCETCLHLGYYGMTIAACELSGMQVNAELGICDAYYDQS